MKKYLISIVILFIWISSAYSSFENNYYGARMNGMGSAFVAVSDDYYSAIINPAGLSLIDKIGMAFSYAIPYWGFDEETRLDNYFLSIVYPNQNIGCFNFYYTRFAVADLYYENAYTLNYGVNINKFFKDLRLKLHTGLGLKLLNKSYVLDKRTQNDPVFAGGTSKSGFSMDFGIIISTPPKATENYLTIGASINNINEPDMGMISEDLINRRYNVGFAYYFVKPKLLRGSIITPTIQYEYCNQKGQILLGAEMWIFRKLLGLRGGWNKNEFSTGFSFNYKIKRKYEIAFDYSFLIPKQLEENYGTHNFSLAFKFLKLKL